MDEIPENDPAARDNQFRGSVLPVLNKKLLVNSLHILFDLLQKCNNKALTTEVSSYLMLAVYAVFRQIYSANPKNPAAMFSVEEFLFLPSLLGESGKTAARIGRLTQGYTVAGEPGRTRQTSCPPFCLTTSPRSIRCLRRPCSTCCAMRKPG